MGMVQIRKFGGEWKGLSEGGGAVVVVVGEGDVDGGELQRGTDQTRRFMQRL